MVIKKLIKKPLALTLQILEQFSPYIHKYILLTWQASRDIAVMNTPHEVRPPIKTEYLDVQSLRCEDVAHLRLGHTYITRSYLHLLGFSQVITKYYNFWSL